MRILVVDDDVELLALVHKALDGGSGDYLTKPFAAHDGEASFADRQGGATLKISLPAWAARSPS
jgi:hypothetical protein